MNSALTTTHLQQILLKTGTVLAMP